MSIEKHQNEIRSQNSSRRCYKCSICGETHTINEMYCPQMERKLSRYMAQIQENKRFFIWGNIFLECMKQDMHIYDISYELSYFSEMMRDNLQQGFYIDMEFALTYCSNALNCSVQSFVKPPNKTIDELLKIFPSTMISWEYDGTDFNDENE